MTTTVGTDRARAIAEAEAAISESDWRWLADWLCRVRLDHYRRQNAEGRTSTTWRVRPPARQEERGGNDTSSRRRIPH